MPGSEVQGQTASVSKQAVAGPEYGGLVGEVLFTILYSC